MEREKVHLEYPLNATSKSILWSAISTPSGLEGWFADRVENKDKEFIFYWGKSEIRISCTELSKSIKCMGLFNPICMGPIISVSGLNACNIL